MADSMLNTLRRIVQRVTRYSDFGAAVNSVVVETKQAMHTDVCSIYLLDESGGGFVLVASDGLNVEQLGSVELSSDQGLVGLVVRRAEPVNVEVASSHPEYYFLPGSGEEAFDAFLGVPIIHQRRVLGVLVVQQETSRSFDEAEEAFLVTLAAQLASQVAHAQALGEDKSLLNIAGQKDATSLELPLSQSETRFLGVGVRRVWLWAQQL